jgi:hypothetical protein
MIPMPLMKLRDYAAWFSDLQEAQPRPLYDGLPRPRRVGCIRCVVAHVHFVCGARSASTWHTDSFQQRP